MSEKKQLDDDRRVPVKSYTGKELQDLYNITMDTWTEWKRPLERELKKLGYRRNQRVYTVKQVELIFDRLGRP